ncbi:hypothetical protein JTB14_022114 [Gonioctena quinquepunctata]|nr:hypothetical protein JTB14_022114 [Gonioctena quinquepunctata]
MAKQVNESQIDVFGVQHEYSPDQKYVIFSTQEFGWCVYRSSSVFRGKVVPTVLTRSSRRGKRGVRRVESDTTVIINSSFLGSWQVFSGKCLGRGGFWHMMAQKGSIFFLFIEVALMRNSRVRE